MGREGELGPPPATSVGEFTLAQWCNSTHSHGTDQSLFRSALWVLQVAEGSAFLIRMPEGRRSLSSTQSMPEFPAGIPFDNELA